jgi:putative transposase
MVLAWLTLSSRSLGFTVSLVSCTTHGSTIASGYRARLLQEPRSVPRLRADGPNQVWSWDISFLPTTVRGVWLYLYLVVDAWSRKVVAWDVAEVESADIAADLVQRAWLKERYRRPSGFGSHQCQQP